MLFGKGKSKWVYFTVQVVIGIFKMPYSCHNSCIIMFKKILLKKSANKTKVSILLQDSSEGMKSYSADRFSKLFNLHL